MKIVNKIVHREIPLTFIMEAGGCDKVLLGTCDIIALFYNLFKANSEGESSC